MVGRASPYFPTHFALSALPLNNSEKTVIAHVITLKVSIYSRKVIYKNKNYIVFHSRISISKNWRTLLSIILNHFIIRNEDSARFLINQSLNRLMLTMHNSWNLNLRLKKPSQVYLTNQKSKNHSSILRSRLI